MVKMLLNAVTALGPSKSLTWPKKGLAKQRYDFFRCNPDHTVQVITTGAPTAVTVNLEGSLNNVIFEEMASHSFSIEQITNRSAMFHVTDKSVEFIRLNLITLTGGSNPTVTALYHGFEIKKRD